MHAGCPTCEALTAAVIAAPADDLPRFVYADHLDGEHADHLSVDVATFIRRQIRGGDAAGFPGTVYIPPPITAQQLPVWRRGFVEEITCPWGDWVLNADAVQASAPLRYVRLTTRPHYPTAKSMISTPVNMLTGEVAGEIDWLVTIDNVTGTGPNEDAATHDALGKRYPGITFTLPRRELQVVVDDPAGASFEPFRQLGRDMAYRRERQIMDAMFSPSIVAEHRAAIAREREAFFRSVGIPRRLLGRNWVG